MKTQIVQLEIHDDINSVRDKMTWGKSSRVLLVWPSRRSSLLNRQIDLVLILRQAAQLGSQLAIVSKDSDVLFHARKLQIPVFRSIEKAQSTRWSSVPGNKTERFPEKIFEIRSNLRAQRPKKPGSRSTSFRMRLIALGIAFTAILMIGAILFPKAKITLHPEMRQQSEIFKAFTNDSTRAVQASGAVPVETIYVIVEGKRSIPSTGQIAVPIQYASGYVTMSNLSGEEIRIPEGTVVSDGADAPIRYTITSDGFLSADMDDWLELPIRAIDPGSGGNLPPNSIRVVEGLLGISLAVDNQDPITGGSDATYAAPTDLDRSKVANELIESLRNTAMEDLSKNLGPEDVLLSPRPVFVTKLQETFNPADLSPSDLVEVTLRLEFAIQVIPNQSIQNLSRMVLDANLPDGFQPQDENLEVAFVTFPDVNQNPQIEWDVKAVRQLQSVIQTDRVIPALLGKTPAEAANRLQAAFTLERAPEIKLTPSWWPRLPLLPVQINFEVPK